MNTTCQIKGSGRTFVWLDLWEEIGRNAALNAGTTFYGAGEAQLDTLALPVSRLFQVNCRRRHKWNICSALYSEVLK